MISVRAVNDTGPSAYAGPAEVTVTDGSEPPPVENIDLSARGYKVKGRQRADLSWSGAGSSSVDIFRDGRKIRTTSNSGRYTDNIDNRGGGRYSYRVCEAGTSACSNNVPVQF